ncbi:MAG: MFS transporter [Lachnospiraceae bacterium]|nr:MFS transporter [Lachnospiraceae bacterium]
MTKEFKYKDVMKNREYRKLLLSSVINRFGDSVDAIAFTWLVYQITKSASWAALIYGLNVLPNIVVQPFIGPIVEKMDKKKVIVVTDVLRAGIITVFAIMYVTGIVNPYIMAGFTILITAVESFCLPASGAFTPCVLKKEELAHGMSLRSGLSDVFSLIGTGCAGVIIAKLGVQAAMLIDASTFLIAGIMVFFTKTIEERTKEGVPENADCKETDRKSYSAMLKDGLSYVIHNHAILNICFVAILMNFFLVPLNSLQAPIAEDIYGLGSELLSVIGMAAAIGGIFGSVITPMIMEKMSVKRVIVCFGMIIGIFMYLMSKGNIFGGAALSGYFFAGLCFFMMVMAASVISGCINIKFVKTCDQSYLARAGAVLGAGSMAAAPIGAILVSFVSVRLSVSFLIALCGISMVVIPGFVALSKLDFEISGKKELTDAAQTLR